MQRRHLLLLFGLGLLAPRAFATSSKAPLRVVIQRDVYQDYLRFIKGRDPLALKHYGGPHSRRDVAELVILQQALQRGGDSRPLQFSIVDSTRRMLKALHNNDADISASSLWKIYADDDASHLSLSLPLVRDGDFKAGLYFIADHPERQKVRQDPSRIRKLTAVCDSAWRSDVRTLQQLGSPTLLTDNWGSMMGMLKKKRADYVLAPFQPTADFSLEAEGLLLKPAEGLKVSLAGSRHFLLSRQAPNADTLERKLNKGLQALKEAGLLQQAYRESGFDDVRVQGWRQLN